MLIRFASTLLIVLLSACASNKPAIQDSAELGPDGQPVVQPLPEGFEDEYRNGLSLMEDQKFEDARQHWADMSVVYGQYPGVWTNLGLAYYQTGNYEEAAASYEKVEEIDPTFCPVHALSGITYRELGRFDDAQASYYAAIDCEPDEGRHYYNLGILLDLYRNDLESALEFYRKARRLMPEDEKLNIWVIDLARRVGVDEADPESIDEWYDSLKEPVQPVSEASEATGTPQGSPQSSADVGVGESVSQDGGAGGEGAVATESTADSSDVSEDTPQSEGDRESGGEI